MQAIQLPPPLPPTLPAPPPVPISYLEGYAEKLGAPAQMSASDQREVLDFLRPLATSTEDPEETQAACDLLRRLRARPEVTFEAATTIDQLLAHAPDRDPTPHGNRKIETTEFLTPVQPSQGAQAAPPPPPMGFPPPPQPAVSPTAPVGSGTPWSTGAFVALLLATVFSAGVVGIVAGLIGRSTPATRNQANIILWSGVGVLALCILAVAMGGATDSCDPAVEFC